MPATEIASAYVALYAKMPGVQSDITKALGGTAVQSALGKSGESMGSRLLDGMNKIGKVGAIAVGGAIAAGLGTALVKGFQRLDALDQAEAKLTGLGHSASTVDMIMDNALASVKGTAFGMGEAATAAAGAVAAGIKPGKDLERTLKAVADASTIAGVDMGSMGAIFNKVAASNKVQMDVINQLHDAGVPALALLAEQMGVTSEEAAKMASAGKIDFETFQKAMESGMGGAALESGNTFSGAMDNVMASLGRVGANLISGLFPDMKNGLSGLIEAMEPLEAAAKDVGKALGEFVGWVKENINWLGPLAAGVGIAIGLIIAWTVVQWALNAAMAANPIGLIIVAIGLLIGAIVALVMNWDEVVAWITEIWEGFVNWLQDIIVGIAVWWAQVWTGISDFFTGIWDGIVGFITDYINRVRLIIAIAVAIISKTWNDIWTNVSSFFTGIWEGIVGAIETVRDTFRTVFDAIRGFIVGAFEGAVRTVKNVINGIIDVVNGAIGGINGLIGTVGSAFGLEVAIPRIPRLADGAIIRARPGGVLANIGEGRYDEVVQPLGGPQFDGLADALAAKLGRSGDSDLLRELLAEIKAQPEKFARKLDGYSRTDRRGWAI